MIAAEPAPAMADILLPQPAALTMPGWIYLLFFMALAAWIWRHFFQPLSRLQRALLRGRLNPRKAAHILAGLSISDANVRQQLDKLRFAGKTPRRDEVLALINKVRHGR